MQIQQGTVGTATSTGSVPVSLMGNSTVGTGTKAVTTAGTRVQLSVASVPTKKIYIQGLQTNTKAIYIGDSTVASSNGQFIFATQTFISTASNLNLLYLDSDVNGESVVYFYEN